MRRFTQTLLIASVLALPLGACSTFDSVNDAIDPTDWFSGFDPFGTVARSRLKGERKPVFPEGVPGVAKGVPPELVKGNQVAPEAEQQQAAIVEEQPKPKPKPKAKPRPKETLVKVERAPTSITVRRQQEAEPAPQQMPQQQAPQQRGATQWPDPPAARTAQQPQGGGPAPGGVQWPDPPPMR